MISYKIKEAKKKDLILTSKINNKCFNYFNKNKMRTNNCLKELKKLKHL